MKTGFAKVGMKKVVAVVLMGVMLSSLTACGGAGEDTKETVQATIDEMQEKMTSVTNTYQDALQEIQNSDDPTASTEAIEKAVEMIETAKDACESVNAPGPDSQKYKAMCVDFFQMFIDMMNDMKSIDPEDKDAIQAKAMDYMGDIMTKASEASEFMQELVDKYGITIPSN